MTIAIFNQLIGLVINDFVIPSVNKQLSAGIPLPAVPGVTFINSAGNVLHYVTFCCVWLWLVVRAVGG